MKPPLERAARALCELDGNPPGATFEGRPMWESYLPQVRAVVEALNEADSLASEIEYRIETVRGDHAVLTISKGGGMVAASLLEAADLEDLLDNLARARAALRDEVPHDLDIGQRVIGVPNPPHHVLHGPSGTGCILAIRHPGYGWLHYMLPPAAATELARALPGPASSPSAD